MSCIACARSWGSYLVRIYWATWFVVGTLQASENMFDYYKLQKLYFGMRDESVWAWHPGRTIDIFLNWLVKKWEPCTASWCDLPHKGSYCTLRRFDILKIDRRPVRNQYIFESSLKSQESTFELPRQTRRSKNDWTSWIAGESTCKEILQNRFAFPWHNLFLLGNTDNFTFF